MKEKLPAQLTQLDIVLCAGTVPNATFTQLLAAARAGNFDAISLSPALYQQAHQSGINDVAMRQMLADNGLCIAELDPLLNWVPGYEFPNTTEMGVAGEDEFYRIADALGARSLNVVWALDQSLPESLLVDAFAAVCERAGKHALLVHVEFVPWAQIANIEIALRIVQQTGCSNAGIMLDSWHHFRGGNKDAVLAKIPGEKIMGVQLSDAPAQRKQNLVEETMTNRLMLGKGDIDLLGIIRQLDHSGCKAPIGVEIFSSELRALSPEQIGRSVGDDVRRLLACVRRG